MSKQSIDPSQLFASLEHGFSQIVSATARTTIFISGQTAWDAHKQIVGRSLAEQARQAFRNVRIAVEAAGASLDDVVSLRIYIVESARPELDDISRVLREMFPKDPPASTWIGVAFLANPDFLIEIEAIAVIE